MSLREVYCEYGAGVGRAEYFTNLGYQPETNLRPT